jgi:hypothetical protein
MRVLHYVNGIMNFPGCSTNWNGRAVTHTHVNTDFRAEKIEYFCGPIDRAFGQKDRAEKLFRTVLFYQGWDIDLVGHSNGADVICTMMKDYLSFPSLRSVHLVCGATDADFNLNGLNRLLTEGRIGRVNVYVAGKDMALRAAHSWLGKVLGYGVLGLHGAVNVLPSVMDRVRTVIWPELGHSDCWGESRFADTMSNFLS